MAVIQPKINFAFKACTRAYKPTATASKRTKKITNSRNAMTVVPASGVEFSIYDMPSANADGYMWFWRSSNFKEGNIS